MGYAKLMLRRLLSGLRYRRRKAALALGVLLGNALLDRASKYLAVRFLAGRGPVGILGDAVVLCLTGNSGAFLGLGSHWSPPVKYLVLLYLPLALCLAALIWLLLRENRAWRIVIIASILGGGMSNLLDRLFNDFLVIDFLNFGVGPFRTGILNLADLSVTFGAAALFLSEIAASLREKASAGKNPAGAALHDAPSGGTLSPMDGCVFCKIVKGELPSKKIFEDGELLAFHDISPQAPVHFVVIPKRHLRNIYELGEEGRELAGKLLFKAQELARELGCEENGARFVVNCKSDGGQTVDHLHLHVLGGRPLLWPPG